MASGCAPWKVACRTALARLRATGRKCVKAQSSSFRTPRGGDPESAFPLCKLEQIPGSAFGGPGMTAEEPVLLRALLAGKLTSARPSMACLGWRTYF